MGEIFGIDAEKIFAVQTELPTKSQVKDLLKELTEADIERLIEFYRLDFYLFQYSPYAYS